MEDKIFTFYTLTSTDEPNRVRYVGVTSSTLKIRFQGHKQKARSKHITQPVHHWMRKKYDTGHDVICTQIDTCKEKDWKSREIYWISYYRKLEPELLNIQKGGSGVVTKEMRTIDGMTRTKLAHIKPVGAYDDEGNLVKTFDSLTEAANSIYNSKGNICTVLQGKKKHCGGYVWKYLDKEKIDFNKYKKKVNPDYNQRIIVYKFDKNNNLVQEYQSARQVMRDLFGEDSTISGDYFVKEIINKSKVYHDYYWSTNKNFIINDTHYRYKEVDKNNNIICLYRQMKDITNKYNFTKDKVLYRIKKHIALDNGNFIEKY